MNKITVKRKKRKERSETKRKKDRGTLRHIKSLTSYRGLKEIPVCQHALLQ